MHDVLTRDNPHLSRATLASAAVDFAINCTADLPDEVRRYVHESLSENTRRAYLSDLAHFEAWGGRNPASDVLVASYLAAHAERLSIATLERRLAAIGKAHTTQGMISPIRSPLVKATIRGIKRHHRKPQRQAKPLLRDDLFLILSATGNELRDVRDRALLLIGFAGGFRRSELAGLNADDIECVPQGILAHLRRSKTDQMGLGRTIAIPHGSTSWCPVSALNDWIVRSGIESGALFRRIDKHGHLLNRLSGEAVSLIIKERLTAACIDPAGYSGHSLRAGFATSAAQAGVSTLKIRAQTGHANDAILACYIRDRELFAGNAVGSLL